MLSRMASEIWSHILSGWPSVTDSDVNRYCEASWMLIVLRRWKGGTAWCRERTTGPGAARSGEPRDLQLRQVVRGREAEHAAQEGQLRLVDRPPRVGPAEAV